MKFDISVNQHTYQDTGSIRRILYSSSTYLDGLINYDGCPHDGGQHYLKLVASREDIIEWLELMITLPQFKTKEHQPDLWLKTCLDHAKKPRHSSVYYNVRKEVFKEKSKLLTEE